jgi:hypothetical protein
VIKRSEAFKLTLSDLKEEVTVAPKSLFEV